jgi:hypothetical protein
VRLIHPDAQRRTENRAQPLPRPAPALVGELRNIPVSEHRDRGAVAVLLDPKLHSCHGPDRRAPDATEVAEWLTYRGGRRNGGNLDVEGPCPSGRRACTDARAQARGGRVAEPA